MMIRGARYFLISILLILSTPAQGNDAEWFGSDDVSTTTPRTRTYNTTQSRRTPIYPWEITPRTKKFETVTSSTTSSSELFPTNITNTLTSLLKNFAKFTSSNPYFPEGNGDVHFINVLKLEIFTIATGNHFVVPPPEDEKTEEKQRKSAGGVTSLWLDLFCTEDIDTILNNVTEKTVVQYGSDKKSLTVNKMKEILQTLFSKLNDAIEEDSFLSTMYTAEQIRHNIRLLHTLPQKKVYIPLSELIAAPGQVDGKMVDAWVNNSDIRKFLIHRQFLDMREKSGDSENGDNLWVTSILKVAREECCIDRMQKVYNTVLNETATNFVTADFPSGTTRIFVSKLTEAIEGNKDLKKEWVNQKNKIEEKLRKQKSNRRERI